MFEPPDARPGPPAELPVTAAPAYQPDYQVPGYPGQPTYAYPSYAYPVARPTNGLAIGAMSTSIAGIALVACYGIGVIPSLVGAILGHIARRRIAERGEAGGGMALAGIIIGWVGVAVSLAYVGVVVFGLYYLVSHQPS